MSTQTKNPLGERGIHPELDHHVSLQHRPQRRAVRESASWSPSHQIVRGDWHVHSLVHSNGYIGRVASPEVTSSGGYEVVAKPSFGSFTTLEAAASAERDHAIECWRAFDSVKAA